MPSYLDLAYYGNYAGCIDLIPWERWELFTYEGRLYMANYDTGQVQAFPE